MSNENKDILENETNSNDINTETDKQNDIVLEDNNDIQTNNDTDADTNNKVSDKVDNSLREEVEIEELIDESILDLDPEECYFPDEKENKKVPFINPEFIKKAKPQKEKTEKTIKNEFFLKCIIVSMIISIFFGMAGTYLFNYYFGSSILYRGNVIINEVPQDEVLSQPNEPNTVPYVVDKCKDSVVAITTNTLSNNQIVGQYVTKGAGSGVIISEDGYIVTNTHVVQDASNILVKLSNDEEYNATIVGYDITSDLTVIKIDVTGLKPATFGNSKNLVVGQTVVAIGNPLGKLGGTVTSGILSAKDRELTINSQAMNLLQFSAAVNPGNSGGGLFDLSGNLIGIVNAKSSGTEVEGLSFAIPIADAKNVITQLIENGKVSGRPQLGVTVIEIVNMADAYEFINDEIYKYITTTGVYISDSTSPHLFKGDRIMAIDGNSVSSFDDIKNYIDDKKVGDTVEVTISRNKKMLTIDVVLSERE